MYNNYNTGLGIAGLGILFTIIISIILFALAIAVIIYLLTAYPLYKMAKKAGVENAFLAWIPIGNMYIMYVIPKKPFQVFNWFTLDERYKGFIMYIIFTLGGSFILGIFSVFSMIPLIGWIISAFGNLAYMAALYIQLFYVYRDLYEVFISDQNAAVWAVLSLFIPIVGIIMLWICAGKEPDPRLI